MAKQCATTDTAPCANTLKGTKRRYAVLMVLREVRFRGKLDAQAAKYAAKTLGRKDRRAFETEFAGALNGGPERTFAKADRQKRLTPKGRKALFRLVVHFQIGSESQCAVEKLTKSCPGVKWQEYFGLAPESAKK